MKKIGKFSGIGLIILSIAACSSFPGLKSSKNTQPGFGNISDIAIPESAHMILEKSVILGDGPTWTGHLVYTVDKPQPEVIDFIDNKTQELGWTKISELRAKETITTFMKDKRFLIVKVSDKGDFFKKTIVSIEMTSSNLGLKNVISSEEEEISSCSGSDCNSNKD